MLGHTFVSLSIYHILKNNLLSLFPVITIFFWFVLLLDVAACLITFTGPHRDGVESG